MLYVEKDTLSTNYIISNGVDAGLFLAKYLEQALQRERGHLKLYTISLVFKEGAVVDPARAEGGQEYFSKKFAIGRE